jgi:predicted acylesterase/phospholipase RssA
MWAAWELGVWKALQPHFQPDLIVGASAGSWVGWAIAGGCTIEDLESEWLDPRTGAIIRFGLHASGVLRYQGLHDGARRLFARFHPRIPFGLTTVEVPRMRLRLVREHEITWEHLAAACSIPLGFPPVRIDGRRYVDGGLLGGFPLWAAEKMGATRAIGLNVLTALPFRVLRKVLSVRQASPAFDVVRIEPGVRLGPIRDALRWSAPNVRRWIAQGEADGTRALESLLRDQHSPSL